MTGDVRHSGAARAIRVVRRVVARGLEELDGSRRRNRSYDRDTVQVMARVLDETSNCIDVGCYRGRLLAKMLDLAPRGTHFAFEPIPSLAAQLRRAFPRVHVHEVALSDSAGTAAFRHVLNYPAYSGLRERSYPGTDAALTLIDVQTQRLDDVVPADMPVAFLKVDVEGAELQVFRGAEQTLRRNKPHVAFEHGLGAAEYYGTRPEMVYDLLVDCCGLRISLLSRWLRGGPPLTHNDFVRQFDRHRNFYFLAHPEGRRFGAGR